MITVASIDVKHVPPNVVSLKVSGDVGRDEVHTAFNRIDAAIGTQPFWLLAIDLSNLGQATVDARRTGAERIGKTPPYSMALYGGSLAQRAIATLFLKLSELWSGDRDIHTKFLKDETSARAWLVDEARRRTFRVRV